MGVFVDIIVLSIDSKVPRKLSYSKSPNICFQKKFHFNMSDNFKD